MVISSNSKTACLFVQQRRRAATRGSGHRAPRSPQVAELASLRGPEMTLNQMSHYLRVSTCDIVINRRLSSLYLDDFPFWWIISQPCDRSTRVRVSSQTKVKGRRHHRVIPTPIVSQLTANQFPGVLQRKNSTDYPIHAPNNTAQHVIRPERSAPLHKRESGELTRR